jgi:DoxX
LRYFDRMQPLGLLVLRMTLGLILVAHGSHKVYGHMQEYGGYIHSLGMPAWLGYVSALIEFVGGILLIAGLLTRCAAFARLHRHVRRDRESSLETWGAWRGRNGIPTQPRRHRLRSDFPRWRRHFNRLDPRRRSRPQQGLIAAQDILRGRQQMITLRE